MREDIYEIAHSLDIPTVFPDEVIEETDKKKPKVSKSEMKWRRDFRGEMVVTIDGDDSKDFDDAVSLRKEGKYYILGVHIADVSHYVKEDSPLDKEAFRRSTSVYLVDVVIPMLPEKLSNNLCSLVPGKERLTLSVEMKIDQKGNIVESTIEESVIKSAARLTYKGVNKILAHPHCKEARENRDLMVMLYMMRELSGLLRENRRKRGAIDFDLPETKIYLTKTGKVRKIVPADRGESEKIIEDFMLAANETVAETMFENKIPLLYRIHDYPEKKKIKALSVLLSTIGVRFRPKSNKVNPNVLRDLLERTQDSSNADLVRIVTLRSMQQAKYAPDDTYHFGLAADYYCHFTSPIRRYPDLIVHRIIKEVLNDKFNKKRIKHYNGILYPIAERTSSLERRAIECEREVNKLKSCEYMADKIGEIHEGYISGVTGWGIYVTLPTTVEGMIPIRSLKDDYYIFNEQNHEFIGKYKKKRYRLGDKIKIEVKSVDVDRRTIDFALAEYMGEEPKDGKKTAHSHKRKRKNRDRKNGRKHKAHSK